MIAVLLASVLSSGVFIGCSAAYWGLSIWMVLGDQRSTVYFRDVKRRLWVLAIVSSIVGVAGVCGMSYSWYYIFVGAINIWFVVGVMLVIATAAFSGFGVMNKYVTD
ncbi:hypothetical protein [Bacillus mycoides]|uniref:hypothetical protein n=1 Tax=Bacillus mycoides TaxID=1405 RepID=UPI003A806366